MLTHDELYHLVWSVLVSRLSRQYGISDVGFKKAHDWIGVPTPPRGYWAKKQHRHDVQPDPLLTKHGGPSEYTCCPEEQ